MYIVRHKPCVLPCVALGVVVLAMHSGEWVEWCAEFAVAAQAAHKASLLVEIVAIALGALAKVFGIGFLAQQSCYLSHTVVC